MLHHARNDTYVYCMIDHWVANSSFLFVIVWFCIWNQTHLIRSSFPCAWSDLFFLFYLCYSSFGLSYLQQKYFFTVIQIFVEKNWYDIWTMIFIRLFVAWCIWWRVSFVYPLLTRRFYFFHIWNVNLFIFNSLWLRVNVEYLTRLISFNLFIIILVILHFISQKRLMRIIF